MNKYNANNSQANVRNTQHQAINPNQTSSENNHALSCHDPVKLLKTISNREGNGLLEIYQQDIHWKIYLEETRIKYASLSLQSLDELKYHLRYLGCNNAIEAMNAAKALEDNNQTAIDRIIDWLYNKGFLNANQRSQVSERVTREALEPLSWLSDVTYQWYNNTSQEPAVSINKGIEIQTIASQLQTRLQSWQQFLDEIQSPYQRPYFFSAGTKQNLNNSVLVKLGKLMRGLSLHQLASIIKQDEIKLARLLYPYIQNGDIFVRDPKPPWNQLPNIPSLATSSQSNQSESSTQTKTATYKIACVDDSPTILQQIQQLLVNEKYEVTQIDNPVEAASKLFRLKPDLVLMDISMPEINGYKLCSLLRNSNALANVPIIMVTSRSGMIDKVRAKTVGATDYLTKPFTKSNLLTIVEKYLSQEQT